MRRIWTRATRDRLLLTAAAVSVIALAASSPVYSAASGGRTSAAECSKAQALEAASRLHLLPDSTLPNPIARVLCGDFAGSGSETMVAVFARATCLPNYGWAAFRFTGGEWQLVPNGSQIRFVSDLVAVGSDLRETVPIWRPGDGPCNPKGGTKARVWHWDGTRLVAGAWRQVTKGEPARRGFYSPSHKIACGMYDDSGFRLVDCQSYDPKLSQTVKLNRSGRLAICQDRGTRNRCNIGNPGEGTPTLAYGKQITVGRFRCLSLRSGMRCTVVRSGKGFLINRDRVVRVG